MPCARRSRRSGPTSASSTRSRRCTRRRSAPLRARSRRCARRRAAPARREGGRRRDRARRARDEGRRGRRPRVLEHLVDCVLQFEGDRYHEHRILRATKNRFGSTNELGVFEMTTRRPRRRRRPVRAVRDDAPGEVGAAVGCALEGYAADSPRGAGARRADGSRDAAARRHGVDPKRLAMIVAVLGRHAGVALASADVFVNVAGASASRSRAPTSPSPWRSPRRRVACPCARDSPRSARSASPVACVRPRRPSGGSRSARSSGSRRSSLRKARRAVPRFASPRRRCAPRSRPVSRRRARGGRRVAARARCGSVNRL